MYELGGGGGGIIQIIAPQGSLANNTLSLKKGRGSRRCDSGEWPNGYFLLKGNYTDISKLGRLACGWLWMLINSMTKTNYNHQDVR